MLYVINASCMNKHIHFYTESDLIFVIFVFLILFLHYLLLKLWPCSWKQFHIIAINGLKNCSYGRVEGRLISWPSFCRSSPNFQKLYTFYDFRNYTLNFYIIHISSTIPETLISEDGMKDWIQQCRFTMNFMYSQNMPSYVSALYLLRSEAREIEFRLRNRRMHFKIPTMGSKGN